MGNNLGDLMLHVPQLPDHTTVYHEFAAGNDQVFSLSPAAMIGKTISDSTFLSTSLSTSLSEDTALHFAADGANSVMASIHLPEGFRALPASAETPTEFEGQVPLLTSEQELLLPRGISFFIQDAFRDVDRKLRVDLMPQGFDQSIIRPFADGGFYDGSGPMLVGERGPEIFNPGSAGYVVPNGQLGGRSSTTVRNNTYYVTLNNPVLTSEQSQDDVLAYLQAGLEAADAQGVPLAATGTDVH